MLSWNHLGRKKTQPRLSPPRSIQSNVESQVSASRKEERSRHSPERDNMRPSQSAGSPPRNIQSNVKSQQISECSRSQKEKSKSWEEAGYIPISPMSDEVTEVQLTLPSERTATPMETAPTRKVCQSTPMFDDPISSASEDENRVSRTTVRSKVVTVPLPNSLRLRRRQRL